MSTSARVLQHYADVLSAFPPGRLASNATNTRLFFSKGIEDTIRAAKEDSGIDDHW